MHYAFAVPVGLGIVCALASAWLHLGRRRCAFALLVLGGVLIRAGFAMGNECLHPWDEQFHALVAKHLAQDMATPALYPVPPPNANPADWAHAHIWLHKPPLFLWQMALAIKLLGPEVYAVRLPSILLTVLFLWAVHSVFRLAANPSVGFWSAWLCAVGLYPVLLVAGAAGMDHNDVAYLAYSWAGLAVLLKAETNTRFYWWCVALAGVLISMAVLSKWAFGLFGLAVWGTHQLMHKPSLRAVFTVVLVGVIAVLPHLAWSLYAAARFATEHAIESAYNWTHIFTPIEGHTGGLAFYLRTFPELYSSLILYALPLLLVGALWVPKARPSVLGALVAGLLGVYLFFSLVVQTKLAHYVAVAIPIVFGLVAIGVWHCTRMVGHLPSQALRAAALAAAPVLLLGLCLKPHTWVHQASQLPSACATQWRAATQHLTGQPTVLHGLEANTHPAVMFYTPCIAHDRVLTTPEVHYYQSRGFAVILVDSLPHRP